MAWGDLSEAKHTWSCATTVEFWSLALDFEIPKRIFCLIQKDGQKMVVDRTCHDVCLEGRAKGSKHLLRAWFVLPACVVVYYGTSTSSRTSTCLNRICKYLISLFSGTAESGRTSGRSQTTRTNKGRHWAAPIL